LLKLIILQPRSVDISTGDVITPKDILFFDDGKKIELWAYNVETVLAEK